MERWGLKRVPDGADDRSRRDGPSKAGGPGGGVEADPAAESGAPAGPAGPEAAPATDHRCDLCGGPMLERHCKLVCLNCGYQRDCSDP